MKRFHVHVNVADLAASVRYYQTLFGCPPSVVKPDYAKWMLDDPRLNFALSQRGCAPGLDHLGLQAETAEELAEIGARLRVADAVSLDEQGAICCYARSDKFWSEDPQGLRWESFRSMGAADTYHAPDAPESPATICCGPQTGAPRTAQASACCGPVTAQSVASGCCTGDCA